MYIYTNCDIPNVSKLSNYIELLISLHYFTLSQPMFLLLWDYWIKKKKIIVKIEYINNVNQYYMYI